MPRNPDYLKQQRDIRILTSCLIEGGHTANGPLLDHFVACQQTGLSSEDVFHAAHYLFDGRDGKKFLEISGEESNFIGTEAIRRIRGENPRQWEGSYRLTEAGLQLAKDEIAVQHLYKQLGDFDRSARRSRTSLRLSIAALAISGLMLIVALGKLLIEAGSTQRAGSQDSTASSQYLAHPDTVTIRESVWATCGPCPSDTASAVPTR